ncbi:MAG: acetaldehyde dehydrogenase, partial [Methanococcaceae archaeon]
GPGTWGGSIVSENVTAKHLMNVKTLAFEVNPINQGNSVNSITAQGSNVSFMQEIEDRLRARAGNPTVNVQSEIKKQEKKIDPKPGAVFGSGLTKSEIDKIINEFKK